MDTLRLQLEDPIEPVMCHVGDSFFLKLRVLQRDGLVESTPRGMEITANASDLNLVCALEVEVLGSSKRKRTVIERGSPARLPVFLKTPWKPSIRVPFVMSPCCDMIVFACLFRGLSLSLSLSPSLLNVRISTTGQMCMACHVHKTFCESYFSCWR